MCAGWSFLGQETELLEDGVKEFLLLSLVALEGRQQVETTFLRLLESVSVFVCVCLF